MRPLFYRWRQMVLLLFLLLFFQNSGVALADPEPPPLEDKSQRQVKHVLIMVMSGVGMDALLHTHAPAFHDVSKEAVKVEQAVAVYPPTNPSALASLATGATPRRHGMLNPLQPLQAETIFQIWQAQGQQTLLVASAEEDVKPLVPGFRQKVFLRDGAAKALTDQALEQWKANKPFATLVVFSDPARAAKKEGPYSQGHLRAISEVDQQIARWIRAIKEAGLYEDTLIIITSDHGLAPRSSDRTDKTVDRELVVPLLLRGPKLKTAVTLPPAGTVDVATTLAQLTGVRRPAQAEGDVLWNALLPGAEVSQEGLYERRVKDLSQRNLELSRSAFQLAEDKMNIDARIENLQEQKRQMQTFTEEKEQVIAALEDKVFWLRCLIGAIIFLAIIGFIVEYWLLRKRFLLFD
ncbi:type i phosphodiesterase/nucleotide pyrophosphatase superfamily [Heliomicrobium modesticaldum Ice1]|uniref:Type i phosphodiesterase/nucleotide pyrophosphatase superfamily n=1 Tax=Heliobacterium modesticaldum (strain ATCC 51547 / Ice1) TaxID=498761 RepID=B0TAJ5_HELMI|nr:alkaline phosphatase family protein [Heliomicrobium modesticaldum]ABZ85045.1 type i phosphodiesterase/nucleotide pyrophosphatase superfamily [Heliomicrobium modesticaldum Ice1]